MSTPTAAIVVLALLATSCAAKAMGPPEIVIDRTSCSHCGMFVSEPVYAAAYQVRDDAPRVFDDIGCMVEALRRETASPVTVWLQDAAGGGWLAAGAAAVVVSPGIRTPMSGGMLAFGDAAAARLAAKNGGAVVMSFDEVMHRKGEAQ